MAQVSIIMPFLNAEYTIAESLNSALSQSFNDFEIICINDGSTDNSEMIVESFLAKDSRIRYISNGINIGVSKSRNLAIADSIGKYILPLDADDLIDTKFLEKCMDVFYSDPEIMLVYSNTIMFSEGYNEKISYPKFSKSKLFKHNIIPNTCVYRKSLWENVGGYSDYMDTGLEDWEFYIKVSKLTQKFHRIDEFLYKYRQIENSRNNQLLSNKENYRKKVNTIRRNHLDVFIYHLFLKLKRFLNFS